MAKIKITKGNVDKLQPPAKGQKLYMDEVLKGFGILVGAKAKTYIAQRDITGRTVRVTLGRHGVITTAQARSEAMETIGLMHRGVNPNDRKRARQGRSITLGDAAELYLGDKKLRSENTIKWFRSCMRLHLSDWQNKPLAEITRQMVNARHRRIGETSGPYAANSTKRAFDVAYNRAMKQYEDLPINPTINIVMFPEYSRNAAISAELLATCHKEIQAILHPIRRDYYLFVLFSGLRRESALVMAWVDLDLDKYTLTIPKPKGGAARAFVLPLSDYLVEILQRRRAENEQLFPGSPWVFPAARSRSGHMAEPTLTPKEKAAMAVPFSIHGLRHTYMTAANAAGLSQYDIKMLVNHSLPKGDVTAGYIGAHTESLRASQQRVTDYLRNYIIPEDGA
jgi:integrase